MPQKPADSIFTLNLVRINEATISDNHIDMILNMAALLATTSHHWFFATLNKERNTPYLHLHIMLKVPIAANQKEFVYKMKLNPIHTILKYGDYHDFMDR